MRIRIAALLVLMVFFAALPAAAEQEDLKITDGFEYKVWNGYAVVTAYRGEYFPRHLPEKLDGHEVLSWFDMDVFDDLIGDWGIYRYAHVSEDEIYIVGWTGFERISAIPESIGGIPVTGIGDLAFYCSGYTRDLFAEVVEVPGSVRTIGREAFACVGVSCILLNEGLEEIGDYAFRGYSQLKMAIPSTVRRMGANPFIDDPDAGDANGYLFPELLGSAYFDTVWDVDMEMLYSVEDMCLITFREDLRRYSDEETVYAVPDGIRIIGDSAFYNTPYLTEVILPDTVEVIEDSAFAGAWRLERVTIPDSVTAIGGHAFEDTPVWELEIPSNVTAIGERILGSSGTIVCDRGSAAEAYALENGYAVRYR